MWWYGFLGVFLLVNTSAKAKQYIVSNDSSEWLFANCTLAEPRLTYKNTFFEVTEPIDVLSSNSDVWIGYVSVKVPYLFRGCAYVSSKTTYSVTSIGNCQILCGHRGIFGINASNGVDILHPSSVMLCRCLNGSVDDVAFRNFNGNQHNLCRNDSYAIFTQITVNDSIINKSGTGKSGDCLTYYFPGFNWQACSRSDNIKVMCSDKTDTDPASRATIHTKHSNTWTQGSLLCLKDNMYPASISRIINSGFDDRQRQDYWTGIIRASTLINKAAICTYSSKHYSGPEYAFVQGNTGRVQLAKNGTKQALCCTGTCMPTTTEIPNPTRNEEKERTTKKTKESSALGAGIGVLVGVLVLVGVAVVVFVLRRRCYRYCTKRNAYEKEGLTQDGKAPTEAKVGNSVANHNYFVLEEHTISEDEPVDHYNTPGDPNEVIADEDNFQSINDTKDRPRGNVQGDNSEYDNTTNGATKYLGRNPDNVYNKLKLDRHGDYDHVHGQGTESRDAQGNGDYDHVHGQGQMYNFTTSNNNNKTEATSVSMSRGARAQGDYHHVKVHGQIHNVTSSNDYDTVSAIPAVEARSAGAKGNESNYNHISNPTSKVH